MAGLDARDARPLREILKGSNTIFSKSKYDIITETRTSLFLTLNIIALINSGAGGMVSFIQSTLPISKIGCIVILLFFPRSMVGILLVDRSIQNGIRKQLKDIFLCGSTKDYVSISCMVHIGDDYCKH